MANKNSFLDKFQVIMELAYSPALLTFLATSRNIHFDGTFQSVPLLFNQMLTIHAMGFN